MELDGANATTWSRLNDCNDEEAAMQEDPTWLVTGEQCTVLVMR